MRLFGKSECLVTEFKIIDRCFVVNKKINLYVISIKAKLTRADQ